MKASELQNPRQAYEDMLIGVGSPGMAAIAVLRNLMIALRSKGVFSEIELSAIFDAAADQAESAHDPLSARFARAVRKDIRGLEGSVSKALSSPRSGTLN